MDWYYAANNQQQGPIPDATLNQLLQSGQINEDTLVWHSGLANWQPLRTARAATSLPNPAAPSDLAAGPAAVCVECHGAFLQQDMIFLNNSWVCAACKNIYLQRLREGSAVAGGAGVIWRLKKQMIARSETPLPDRCIKCNEPANGYRLKRKLWWHPPAYYILVVVSLLVYLIVALIVRKQATLHVGLCEKHRDSRVRFVIICWLTALLGIGCLIAGAAMGSGFVAILGGLSLLASIIVGMTKARVLTAMKIDKEFAWVKGPCPEYLDQFPEWSGRP